MLPLTTVQSYECGISRNTTIHLQHYQVSSCENSSGGKSSSSLMSRLNLLKTVMFTGGQALTGGILSLLAPRFLFIHLSWMNKRWVDDVMSLAL